MRRLSEADGQRVISRDSAEQVGTLRHVVIDVAAERAERRKDARIAGECEVALAS